MCRLRVYSLKVIRLAAIQVHVRPFVVLLLLRQLLDEGHAVFQGKGSAETLKRKIARGG